MLIGWRDQVSINPETYMASCARFLSPQGGLYQDNHDEFAAELGLVVEPAMCYAVEGFAALLEASGPLWVGYNPWGGHAVIVTAMRGDGTPEGTTVVFHDPQPVGQGRADVTERFDRFMEMFESYAGTDQQGNVNIQIIHTGAGSRSPSRSAAGDPDRW